MPFEFAQSPEFDLKLAQECAAAFHTATGLPCTISGIEGEVLTEFGTGCQSCRLCEAIGRDKQDCEQAGRYGLSEAERFGGRYIYFCPVGLTCFVSPIVGSMGSVAKITVGPFLMVDKEDFISFELEGRLGVTPGSPQLRQAEKVMASIPYVEPSKVNALSILLFMSAGFMDNVWAASQQMETQQSNAIQGQIHDYIYQLKLKQQDMSYPIEIEKKLLHSISMSDKKSAGQHLNELLGSIFFSSGNDLEHIKSRVYELLVLISRAAVEGGADVEHAFQLNHRYLRELQWIQNIYQLCDWVTKVMNLFMDTTFALTDVKHVDTIHKAVQYVRRNYQEKISLEDVAQTVYLSPSYFSKVFKEEMGCNFSTYLNQVRIDKSKKLLLDEQYKLIDIAVMVGFEDQSYFTKVFKRVTGVSPSRFREAKGRIGKGR